MDDDPTTARSGTWRAAQERAVSELRGHVSVDHARMRLATLEVLLATALALAASPPPLPTPSSPALN